MGNQRLLSSSQLDAGEPARAETDRESERVGKRTLLDGPVVHTGALPAPGRTTLTEALAEAVADVPRPAALEVLCDHGLRDVLAALAPLPNGRALSLAARHARLPAGRTNPAGEALWRVAEKRAVTIYRSAEHAEGRADDPAVETALAQIGAGRALSTTTRVAMERALGVSLERVRIHTDGVAARAARTVRAAAFTVGEDIFFARGAFAPETTAGAKLLAHELTHVVQHWQGRTTSGGGGIRVSDPGEHLEREADAAAERAVSPPRRSPAPVLRAPPRSAVRSSTIFRSTRDEPMCAPVATQEALYRHYQAYVAMQTSEDRALAIGGMNARAAAAGRVSPASRSRAELEAQLRAHGFASLDAYRAFITRIEQQFERQAAGTVVKILAGLAARLSREAADYSDRERVSDLHRKLAVFRTHHAIAEHDGGIAADYARDSELARLPGNAHLQPKLGAREAAAASHRAAAAGKAERAELAGLAAQHPVFHEDGLPADKRIDKQALANASETALGPLVQAQIASRLAHIAQARALVEREPAIVYQLPDVLPRCYAEQSIAPGSLRHLVVEDKLAADAARALELGIAYALVGIALTVLSLGAAVPAIVATGSAIATAGLSATLAFDEYKQYVRQRQVADVGFADEPSVAWLVLAVLGALLDLPAAARSARAFDIVARLGGEAKVLESGGKLVAFEAKVDSIASLEPQVAQAIKSAAAKQVRPVTKPAAVKPAKAKPPAGKAPPAPTKDQLQARAAVQGQQRTLDNMEGTREALLEELEVARAEHAALAARAKPRSPELQASARNLRKLEGALANTERHLVDARTKLTRLEADVARFELSPYQRLRAAVPSREARARAMKLDPEAAVGPLKTKAKPQSLEADHIVSVHEVSEMEDFLKLPFEDQKAIVDMPANLVPMDAAANSSKGNQSWRSWRAASRFYDEATVAKMVKREDAVRAEIQAAIKSGLGKAPTDGR